MEEFLTLKNAIDSWYGQKVFPSIVVVLTNGVQIKGCLNVLKLDEIIIKVDGQSKIQIISVSEINQVDLHWCGSDLPDMGELDGTGMEGMSIPTAHWHHRIIRSGDNKWLFQEVSKTGGTPYEGEIYKARYQKGGRGNE